MLLDGIISRLKKIRKILCNMDEKLDQILLNCGGGGASLDFISDDPMSSARGIDAEWGIHGTGGSFILPHEPTYIYSIHRNGIEQESSQYNITGTTLSVYPALGSATGGENEILVIKYKYSD